MLKGKNIAESRERNGRLNRIGSSDQTASRSQEAMASETYIMEPGPLTHHVHTDHRAPIYIFILSPHTRCMLDQPVNLSTHRFLEMWEAALLKAHEGMLFTLFHRDMAQRFFNRSHRPDEVIGEWELQGCLPQGKRFVVLRYSSLVQLLLSVPGTSCGEVPLPPKGIHLHHHDCSLHPAPGRDLASTGAAAHHDQETPSGIPPHTFPSIDIDANKASSEKSHQTNTSTFPTAPENQMLLTTATPPSKMFITSSLARTLENWTTWLCNLFLHVGPNAISLTLHSTLDNFDNRTTSKSGCCSL